MIRRLIDQLKFQIECLIVRGTSYQLLIVAGLIAFLAVAGGLVAHYSTSEFRGPATAIWWAFLRLSDPGYLIEDRGLVLRAISTFLTLAGHLIFIGTLIAILTQWLNRTVRTLESGLTPIVQNNHVLILGWTNRAATIIRELLLSGSHASAVLRGSKARRLEIVILAREVSAALVQELKDQLGDLWNEGQITFRSGSPLRIEHLRRVDYQHASVIVVSGSDFAPGLGVTRDIPTIKSLLTLSNPADTSEAEDLPFVVAEIFDSRQIPIAKAAYRGSLEVLPSDIMVSRLIAQNARHPGLSSVYRDLLSQGRGNSLFVRRFPQFDGVRTQDLMPLFPRAIVLGVVQSEAGEFEPIFNPPDGFVPKDGSLLAFLAHTYEDTEPLSDLTPQATPRADRPSDSKIRPEVTRRDNRVLLLGWSHKVAMLIREFDSYHGECFSIDLLSPTPIDLRVAELAANEIEPKWIRLRHLEGDYTLPPLLERLDLQSYNTIVLLASDETGSGERSDAETLLGYLLIRNALGANVEHPNIVVELLDPGNAALFRRRPGEVLVSPLLLSHMLAQIALRRELGSIFEYLLSAGGTEIFFRPAAWYAPLGREVTFAEVQRAAALRGATAVGIRVAAEIQGFLGRVFMNPEREKRWILRERDEVIVLEDAGSSHWPTV